MPVSVLQECAPSFLAFHAFVVRAKWNQNQYHIRQQANTWAHSLFLIHHMAWSARLLAASDQSPSKKSISNNHLHSHVHTHTHITSRQVSKAFHCEWAGGERGRCMSKMTKVAFTPVTARLIIYHFKQESMTLTASQQSLLQQLWMSCHSVEGREKNRPVQV